MWCYVWLNFWLLIFNTEASGDQQISNQTHWRRVGCSWKKGEAICGDTCISSKEKCECGDGNQRQIFTVKHKYCCVDENGHEKSSACTKVVGKYEKKDSKCDNLMTLNMSVPCHGSCYNDYRNDAQSLSYDTARYKCRAGDCELVLRMCRGYPACSDGSDVEECGPDLKCGWSPAGHIVERLPGGHRYCHYKDWDNNNVYNTIGRTDENATVSNKKADINTDSIVKCNVSHVQGSHQKLDLEEGLTCGKECFPQADWCRDKKIAFCNINSTSSSGFSTNDPQLCGNYLFWKTQPCKWTTPDGATTLVGQRCTGAIQHCYFPWYRLYNAQTNPNLKASCEDKSDQIIEVNTTCGSVEKFIEIYNETICGNKRLGNVITHCDDLSTLADQVQNDSKRNDPHNCMDSCKQPGVNCTSCTNPNYMRCMRNNRTVCLHPKLTCDGHKHCDNGEDEDKKLCIDSGAYEKKKIINKYATVICPNLMYPSILTVATACDNIVHCYDGKDESNCNKSEYIGLIITAVSIMLVYVSLKLSYKVHKRRQENMSACNTTRDQDIHDIKLGFTHEDLMKEYKDLHNDSLLASDVIQKINTFYLNLRYTRKREERKEICLKLFDLEEKMHGHGNFKDIYTCLKNRINDTVSKDVLGFKFPRRSDVLSAKLEVLDKYHKYISVSKKILGLLAHYIDLYKDIFIVYAMLSAVGGFEGVTDFPTKFSSVVIISSAATIVLPLWLSSMHLAANNPGMIFHRGFQNNSTTRTVVMAVGVMFLSVANPILLLFCAETIKEKIRHQAKKCENHPRVTQLLEQLKKIQEQYAVFIFTEVNLETYPQAVGQIILVFLARSQTATTGGLEVLFQSNVEIFFIISAILSFRSCIFKTMKALTLEKMNLRFSSKIIVFLWSTFATLRRILGIFIFFVPSLGLLNILHHWKAEQLQFWIRKHHAEIGTMKDNDKLYLFNQTEDVLWSDIDRWNYTDRKSPKPPEYWHYTGYSLGTTFLVFFGLSVFHLICIFIVKLSTMKRIRRKDFNLTTFIRILKNLNLPLPLKEWDRGHHASVEKYQRRFRRQNLEMGICFGINFAVTVAQMIPLWWTGIHTCYILL